ncbi:MAG TPA: ABC transporter permease, partial [Longimicrobiales bacterium]|nr:ABC transporter permease [Longimicrobiales bacterium]
MSALPPDPPRWAGRLLRALLADDDHGRTILGDLHEEFGEVAADRGRGSAVAWYWWQVAVVGVGYARPGAAAVRDLGGDVRHGFRTLRRSPGFSLSVIGTLALGIGAGTAVVSVVDAVLIRPLPFPEPAELVRVWASDETGGRPAVDMLYSDVEAVSRGAEGLRAVTGLSVAPRTLLTARMEEPEAITVARTAGPFFATFGISPAAGRLYGEAEEGAGVLVISEALFRRRFGGDPAALRGLVHVDTRGFEIVGVVPERMSFPEGVDAWRPLTAAELEDDDREVRVFARLGDGVGVSAATAELRGVAAGLAESRPTTHGGFSAWAQPLQAMVVRDVRTALFAFLGAVALVLLVTCVNTANLLLARGAHRRHDLAVRAALGAGRLRIVRASLAESLVLAVLGGAAGIVAGRWALDLILAVSPRLPRMDTIHLDLRVMALMAGITAVVGILFGVGPALHAAALPSGNALREGAVGGSRAGGRGRLQSGLVAAEIALSTALAVLAVLLFGTFQTAARHDRGFEPSNLVAFNVDPMHPPQPGEEAWDYFRRMSAGVAALPEVEQVGLGSHLIVEQRGFEVDVEVEGFP